MSADIYVDVLGTLALPASGSVYSRARPVRARVSVSAVWTGTPAGAFKLQCSFDGGAAWYDVPGASLTFTSGGNAQPAGNASVAIWTFLDIPGGLWRIAYTGSSGTGSAVLRFAAADVAADAGASWSVFPFSTSIAMRGMRSMPQQAVSGPLAFTVDPRSTVGGQNTVRLVADGVNAPTFTGMTESGASMGYNNTAGVVNTVNFWFDGYEYQYQVLQTVAPVPVSSKVRFSSLATCTESGNGTTGWNYDFVSTGSASSPSLTLAAAADGTLQCVLGAFSGNSVIMGWGTTVTAITSYTGVRWGIYGSVSSGFYASIDNGGIGTPNGNAALAYAATDVMRLRRVGSSMLAEVSKNSGSSWTLVHTYSGVGTGQLWPTLNTVGPAIANNITHVGLT